MSSKRRNGATPPLDTYWASLEDHKELLSHLDNKIRDYYDDLRSTGLLSVYERSFRAYYGGRVGSSSLNTPLFEGSRLGQGGKQGEKTRIKANHFRNLIRHLYQLATSQKPQVQARASNSDYKSQSQTILGNGLIDYYWREKQVGPAVRESVEVMLMYAEAFIHAPWDPNAGETIAVDPMTQRPIYEGDQQYSVHGPMDVIRDSTRKADRGSAWKIIRSQENKWDLVAKYPELRDLILETEQESDDSDQIPSFQLRSGSTLPPEDYVDQFIFYHAKTDAMPQGRLVIFLRDLVLFDGPLPYREVPVFRLCAEPLHDTIYGYTIAWDLLGIQEGIDELHTILMSNNKTFGAQNIWIKDTDKLQTSALGGGMKLFKSEEPPTPIQLTKSAPESYTYLDKLEHTAELLSGISSTVRGNPESNLKSGNALALVVSQSIQFSSSLEDALNKVVEEVGTALITNLRDFSRTKRVANIIGESQRPFAKEFTSDDLSEINRVVVEQVNPLAKTIAGRAEIANNLLQQGLIADPQQYMMVLSTGQLDPVMEGPQAEMLTIRAENEELRNGKKVQAVMTENHALHIREHRIVINSPESKKNPQLLADALEHIQEHLDLWRSADPALLMITGQQPPPPPAMAPAPTTAAVQQQGNPVEQQAETSLPNMPELPEGAPTEAQIAYDKLPK